MKRNRRGIIVIAALMAAALVQGSVGAGLAASEDRVYYDGNGYLLVETLYESWADAESAAAALPDRGCAETHLATITSAGEQAILTGLVAESDANAWLGGFQPVGELSLADGWEWITGETWGFTNWAENEPNDTPYGTTIPGSEQYLEAYQGSGEWNDAPDPDLAGEKYYVVEYEDCPAAWSRPLAVEIIAIEAIGVDGEFTATGPAVDAGVMCQAGTTDDLSVTVKPGKKFVKLDVLKEFTCDDLTGTFEARLKVKLFPDNTTTAQWKVVSGTGDYETLRGSGALVGTPIVPGESIQDVYTGKLKR